MFNTRVTLLNGTELLNIIEEVGEIANICVTKPQDEVNISQEQYYSIGKFCIEAEHGSALRFHHARFLIENVSRCCANQLVRHSVGFSIIQQSQRYTNTNDLSQNVVIPKSIINNPRAFKIYKNTILNIEKSIKELNDIGIPQEDVRYIYPNSTFTNLIVSCSLQALIHFCNVRLCNRSQHEIREVAKKMRDAVIKVDNTLDKYLQPKCISLGYCNEGKMSCGKMPLKEKALGGIKNTNQY